MLAGGLALREDSCSPRGSTLCFKMAVEVKNKAAGVALMSSLAYSFCSVSMVMSNKVCGVCVCSLLVVVPAEPVGVFCCLF